MARPSISSAPAGKKTDAHAKDGFEALDSDFKDKVAQSSSDVINDILAGIAKDTAALDKAKEEDVDLENARQKYKDAGAIYRDGKKENKLKTKYCIRVLGDQGKL